MRKPAEFELPLGSSCSSLLRKRGCFVVRGLCSQGGLIDSCRDRVDARLGRVLATRQTLQEYHDYFGAVADEDDSQACRWSLLVSLKGAVLSVLKCALGSLGPFFAEEICPDAELCDLNCFVSDKGSCTQTPHFDTAFDEEDLHAPERVPSRLITVFVALQDVTEDMGPTLLWEGTHTLRSHEALVDWQSQRQYTHSGDADLRGIPLPGKSLVACLLRKGDALVMDSRLVHAGSANLSRRRSLLAFSFCVPRRAIPGQTHCIMRRYCGLPLYALRSLVAEEVRVMSEGEQLGATCAKLKGTIAATRGKKRHRSPTP